MKSITESLIELIKIESVKSSVTGKGAPFGWEIRRALDYALELGAQMGFVTRNLEGYVGEIEYGTGDKVLGILAHLDIVPVGGGWTKEQGAIEDGIIYGRGAVDDKGPLLAALYALKELKDEGFQSRKTIRLIMGCDEESGSKCMEYYNHIGRMPDEGFSPDADFPLVICEKTIMQVRLDIDARALAADNIFKINGGHRVNMVADFATAEYRENGAVKNIRLLGKSAHGSTPQEGDNALWKLFGFLGERYPENGLLQSLNKYLMCDTALHNSGLYISDDQSGDQTLNVGKADYDINRGVLSLWLDFRCPITQTTDKILPTLERLTGGRARIEHGLPYLYADPESELVQGLLTAYREVTGDYSEPKVIGGGTYARALKNGVAFGPTFPGQETRIHDADEFITIDNLMRAKEVYKRAIVKLCE